MHDTIMVFVSYINYKSTVACMLVLGHNIQRRELKESFSRISVINNFSRFTNELGEKISAERTFFRFTKTNMKITDDNDEVFTDCIAITKTADPAISKSCLLSQRKR